MSQPIVLSSRPRCYDRLCGIRQHYTFLATQNSAIAIWSLGRPCRLLSASTFCPYRSSSSTGQQINLTCHLVLLPVGSSIDIYYAVVLQRRAADFTASCA